MGEQQEYGHWWRDSMNTTAVLWCGSYQSYDTAEAARLKSVDMYRYIEHGPTQLRSDPNPFEVTTASGATPEPAPVTQRSPTVAPPSPLIPDEETLARVTFDVDPRPAAFVAARNDSGVTMDAVWRCDQNGWRSEAEGFAKRVFAAAGGRRKESSK